MEKLLSRLKIVHNLTNDDVREIAMVIVDKFVLEGLIEDNTDTNDDIEFRFQDIIHLILNEVFNIEEEDL
jgi:hypothetical protein